MARSASERADDFSFDELAAQQLDDWADSYAAERAQYKEAAQAGAWWVSGTAAAVPERSPSEGRGGGAAGPGSTVVRLRILVIA